MFAPPDRATRIRYLVAEMVVVLFVGVSLLVAYRIDPQWISRHVTLLNLWPPPDPEAWSGRGRGVLVLLSALMVVGLRPALMFVAARWSLAGAARATVATLLAIAVFAVIAEAMVGWTRGQASKALAVYQQKGDPDPRYGWTWKPSSTVTGGPLGRDIHWAFDREGDRVENEHDEPDPTRPTILFTGESIALGMGLDHAETYPALIAARRRVQSVNVAANAYGSDQAYLRLIDAMPRFRRLVATVTLFLPVQLGRNLHDDRPRLVLGPTGRLELVPAATDFLSRLQARRLLRNELPYLGDAAIHRTMALTAAILRETSVQTRAHRATPLFVIPSNGPVRPFDEHPEAWILRELFVKQGLRFILVDIPPDQLLGDSHPGPRGEETIAAAILAALPSDGGDRGAPAGIAPAPDLNRE